MVTLEEKMLTEKRAKAVALLQEEPNEEHLWECVILFQKYPFKTMKGFPFSYSLKMGKNGFYTRELWIDRRENSKSLTWGSVMAAFRNTQPKRVIERPKALGDIRGVSYLYPMFYCFGLIDIPDKTKKIYE